MNRPELAWDFHGCIGVRALRERGLSKKNLLGTNGFVDGGATQEARAKFMVNHTLNGQYRYFCTTNNAFPDMSKSDVQTHLDPAEAVKHTEEALAYMAQYGIRPEGHIRPFYPPSVRSQVIDRMPYEHDVRQRVTYETEAGEFTAVCPFSGLPDFGIVRIEYVPNEWILELKSLKYYLMSWREIGATQEDITAYLYKDISARLGNPEFVRIETVYNIRGGILTTCVVDSRE